MNFEVIRIMAEAEEAATESSLFSPDQFAGYAVTAVFTVINVLIAYIFIKKLLFKPILKMMKNRQAVLDGELDAATKSKEEADAVVAQSKETIDEARRQAAAIMEEARENASKQSDMIIKAANEEANEITARAEEDVLRIRRVALEEMKDDITDLAVKIAQKVIGDSIPETQLRESASKNAQELINQEVKASE
ncbi:MAG: F0F1 ATP synthase subunit B [Saccharofermentans sp.]|nr:F0F1 ATP synthase subunit B [Saccharofermentans sp.]